MNADAFEQLLDSYRLGQATPAEMAELANLLQGNPEWRFALVEHFLLEVHLRKAFTVAAAPEKTRSRRWPWIGVAGLSAAAVVLLAMASLTLISHPPVDLPGDTEVPGNQVRSGKVSIKGETATRIPDGVRFQVLGNEPAVIDFPDGSRAELEPSSQAVLRGPAGEVRQVVELAQGGGRFRVTPGGDRFQVQTPAGTITVLGTAFTARLQPWTRKKKKGVALDVQVQEGSVQVEMKGKRLTLAAGDKKVFGKQKEEDDDDD